MKTINAEVIFYDNVNELEFSSTHPYWISINGYVIKISKKTYEELMFMHEFDDDLTSEE